MREEGEEELPEREGEEGIKEEEELPEDMEAVDWDALLDDQFDAGAYNSERTEYDPNWETDREPQENRITAVPPLLEHLYNQLGEIGNLEPEEHTIAEYIIGNIDERGYVGCSLAEIADGLAIKVAAVEKVLRVIQTFDPPGVGARDLRECLMIQLSQRDDPLSALALQVVCDLLEDLTRRRLQRINPRLGYLQREAQRSFAGDRALTAASGPVGEQGLQQALDARYRGRVHHAGLGRRAGWRGVGRVAGRRIHAVLKDQF